VHETYHPQSRLPNALLARRCGRDTDVAANYAPAPSLHYEKEEVIVRRLA
jgi:hypothetical protein